MINVITLAFLQILIVFMHRKPWKQLGKMCMASGHIVILTLRKGKSLGNLGYLSFQVIISSNLKTEQSFKLLFSYRKKLNIFRVKVGREEDIRVKFSKFPLYWTIL